MCGRATSPPRPRIAAELQAEGHFVARQEMTLAGVELLTLLYDNPVTKSA